METEPKVLFEDKHVMVLSKPPGLLSQGGPKGVPDLVSWLRSYLGRNYVGLVHRLDRNTSGLILVAKRSKAAERLTRALQKGEIQRTYLAILMGKISQPARWMHWLKKDEDSNKVSVRGEEKPGYLAAALSIRPIEFNRLETLSLCELQLETGRSHQIRAQSAFLGHPVLGDRKYGGERAAKGLNRPALHSWKIKFPHPMTAEILEIVDPIPEDMERAFTTSV